MARYFYQYYNTIITVDWKNLSFNPLYIMIRNDKKVEFYYDCNVA